MNLHKLSSSVWLAPDGETQLYQPQKPLLNSLYVLTPSPRVAVSVSATSNCIGWFGAWAKYKARRAFLKEVWLELRAEDEWDRS